MKESPQDTCDSEGERDLELGSDQEYNRWGVNNSVHGKNDARVSAKDTAYDSWAGMVNKSQGWKRRCSRIGNHRAK